MPKKLILLSSLVFITGFFLCTKPFAATSQRPHCTMTKNLHKQHYPERFVINENIQALAKGANGDAYRLSMVLTAYAEQGDEKAYLKTLVQIQHAFKTSMQSPEQNSFHAWLLGRVLLAADTIGDKKTRHSSLISLKALLADSNTSKDALSAWAWGYLAALNLEEYALAKQNMLASAVALTDEYQSFKSKHSPLIEEDQMDLQAKLSNALWAWVMASQAAANRGDVAIFQYTLEQMQAITGQQSVADALSIGLQRVSSSNDYPAWALSIVRLAAATIKDEALYEAMGPSLQASIAQAKEAMQSANPAFAYGAKAEATLAGLKLVLSRIRIHEDCALQNDASSSPIQANL